MPVQTCQIDGVSGYKWGEDGKCYTGPDAERKAEQQGRAIEQEADMMRASLSVVIGTEPPSEFVIFTLGNLSTSKGEFVFDDDAAARVMLAFQEHGADRLPIDFDHGMLAAVKTPETSVAAGWFTPAIVDNKLMALNVEWTERAAAMLRGREFRFLSPAFNYDRKTGQITQLLNVALTNLPATRDAEPLVANQLENVPSTQSRAAATTNEVRKVSEKILAVLGAATENEAVNIAKEFNSWSREVLAVTGTETLDAAAAAIKLNAELPAKVAELSQQIKSLTDEKQAQDRDQLIGKLSEAGKLPPSLHDWARGQSMESLSTFGDAAPTVAPVSAIQPQSDGAIILSDEDEEAIKLGLATRESFMAERKRESIEVAK
ncbi:MAG: phage protease [Alphaproteobacteria bacterium]